MDMNFNTPVNGLPDFEFDYSVWAANSRITLCKVPFDNSYRDVVSFSDDNKAIETLSKGGETIVIDSMTYLPIGRPIRLNIPFGLANRFNYAIVTNPAQPITGDTTSVFFYFINGVNYLAPNTSELFLQLDVWQTYSRSTRFGRCYVERGHVGIAASNAFDGYGAKFLTVPEGFDLGAEYLNSYVDYLDVSDFGVIITTTIELDGNYGDQKQPKLKSSKGSNAENLPNGASIYYADLGDYLNLRSALEEKPWIAQGIISVTAIPKDSVNTNNMTAVSAHSGLYRVGPSGIRTKNKSDILLPNFRDRIVDSISLATNEGVTPQQALGEQRPLPGRYSRLKKFQTYPYSAIEITAYTGTPLIIKPETLANHSIEMERLTHAIPPSPRIMWTLRSMNSLASYAINSSLSPDKGDYLDKATGFINLPSFSLTNNNYILSMANQAHSLTYSYSSADWAQQKSLTAATNSKNISERGMSATALTAQIGRNLASDQTRLANDYAMQGALIGGAASVVGGVTGGVAGVAAGAVGAGMNILNTHLANEQRSAQTALSNTASRKTTDESLSAQRFGVDTNYAYSQYAANGDYAQTIAGIEAKIQDTQLVPPSMVGQVGGDAFLLACSGWRLFGKIKVIPVGAIRFIGEYWLRYGYAMNVFVEMPKDYMVMDTFTYWKVLETSVIESDCPESFKQALRGILEKGVTVWKNPNDIGRVDPVDNVPLDGVKL